MGSSMWNEQRIILQSLLRQFRKESSLTQKELSDLLGKHQSYVSKYESGERRLDLIELKEIAECCGVSLSRFVEIFELQITKGK